MWERQEVVTDWGVCAQLQWDSLSGAHGGRGWCVGRESTMAALPLVHHSAMAPCFQGSLCFLQEHSWLQSSSLLSPQAVSSQPITVTSLDLLSKPHVPAPICTSRHLSQARAHRAVRGTNCVGFTLSCLTQTCCCARL